jgi:hypothetical protein
MSRIHINRFGGSTDHGSDYLRDCIHICTVQA